MSPAALRRAIANRRDALNARAFTRFSCLKLSVYLAAGLSVRGGA